MKNPPKYNSNEIKYLEKVLNSDNWSSTSGTWCQTLEKKFSKKFKTKYAVAMNSGTATLHSALEAVGVMPGDEVISPALTVVMDSTATFHANAIPVYADIDPHTFNVDPSDIKRKITKKTKAIIVVSLYGLPCDMDEIMKISREHNIPVIEDNAQCFLSTYKGKLAGTFGDIASYSFENSKHMSCGEGGIIITNNEEYARKCRKVAGHGYRNLQAEDGLIKLNQSVYQDPNYKRHDTVGWNYRLSEISAAIAIAQLEKLEKSVEMRKKVSELFLNEMSCADYMVPQLVPSDRTNSYFTLGVAFEGLENAGITWQEFRNKYIENGGDGIYGAWSLPYLEPVISERHFVKRCPSIYKNVEYKKGICPIAEEIQPKLMQFKTNYRDLKLAESKAIALSKTIKYFKEKK